MDRREAKQTLSDWRAASFGEDLTGWEAEVELDGGRWNYVLLSATCTSTGAENWEPRRTARLEWAPDGSEYETESSVQFWISDDGSPHCYLLPVGCSPGWAWRRRIARLRLISPTGCRFEEPTVECWRVNEVRRSPLEQRLARPR
jgi:hypothetical protein